MKRRYFPLVLIITSSVVGKFADNFLFYEILAIFIVVYTSILNATVCCYTGEILLSPIVFILIQFYKHRLQRRS